MKRIVLDPADGAEARLRIEVTDTHPDRRPPTPGSVEPPLPGAESGRGLLLVEALAARWGVIDPDPADQDGLVRVGSHRHATRNLAFMRETTYSMVEASGRLGAIAREVSATGEPVAITAHGQITAVLVSPADALELQETRALAAYGQRQAVSAGVPHHEAFRRVFGGAGPATGRRSDA